MRTRPTSRNFSPRILLTIVVFIVGAALLTACPKQARGPHKRLPAAMEKKSPEVVRPDEETSPNETANPKRIASQELVDKGIALLDANDINGAIQSFQNAINVDPTNGVAYFYLARATAANGQPDAALGFLDKAEALIGREEDWREEIEALRHDIASPAGPTVNEPIEENDGSPSNNNNGY